MLSADALAERAEILVDRHWWRLDGEAAAEEAVGALVPSDPVLAGFLRAQVRYTRLLFGLDPRADDLRRAREDFTAATADARLSGWAVFWLGVLADNVDGDPGTAGTAYQQAMEQARKQGDTLLESYGARHIGARLLERDREEGITRLRRSYHLRAALGARPQTAAAALTLAGELPPGAEADQLREAAALTARELELTWLLRAL
ncbi:hypothetical protein AVL59_38455 [Streptomyces griseochromogenes]|uniref:Uncharacterized protein n=1 Tax=Streptomyces griseochromogenes TaxID=68214 RepID=A0A1B1BE44_9ACTN|nr:hypothetical protein AVL59_38455 [Streptomyces griseochromogenes]